MAICKALYSDIKNKLRETNVFFRVNGTDRHQLSDILQ
jgi:hypothetical protein